MSLLCHEVRERQENHLQKEIDLCRHFGDPSAKNSERTQSTESEPLAIQRRIDDMHDNFHMLELFIAALQTSSFKMEPILNHVLEGIQFFEKTKKKQSNPSGH